MARSDDRSLLKAIDKLYAAAMEPKAWHDFLRPMASLFNADNAYLSEIDFNSRRVIEYIGLPQPKRDKLPVTRFETMLDQDPRMVLFNLPSKKPVHCRMAASDERLHGSRAYQDYLKPLNIEYTMVTNFKGRTSNSTLGIGLTRGREKAEFERTDRELFAEFASHLERCFSIRAALDTRATLAAAPLAPAMAEHDLLCQTFGLTPVQANLTLALFNGRNVKQAAEELSITEGSARQYLYRVFDKTGVRRQTDLIRLLGSVLKDGA